MTTQKTKRQILGLHYNMLQVGIVYLIEFPTGGRTKMTLKTAHEAKKDHEIRYTFIDDSGAPVGFTLGLVKRMNFIDPLAFLDLPPVPRSMQYKPKANQMYVTASNLYDDTFLDFLETNGK